MLIFKNGVVFYEGDWIDNSISGYGRQRFPNGELAFDGLFRDNAAVLPFLFQEADDEVGSAVTATTK